MGSPPDLLRTVVNGNNHDNQNFHILFLSKHTVKPTNKALPRRTVATNTFLVISNERLTLSVSNCPSSKQVLMAKDQLLAILSA